MQKYYIYKILNHINNKVYIGQTCNLKRRWQEHIKESKKISKKCLIHRAINKYGIENFEIIIIEEVSSLEEANEKEIYWIEYYKSNIFKYGNDFGYNMALGGSGTAGIKHTEEYKINRRGSKCPTAKLTENQVKEIKRLIIDKNLSNIELSKLFNVKPGTISGIRHNKNWSHIKMEVDTSILKTNIPGIKLTEEQVLEIRQLLIEQKLSFKEIEKIYNINNKHISLIKNNTIWKDIGTEFDACKIPVKKKIVKLTAINVLEIRKLITENKSNTEIATIFNVHPTTIADIRLGHAWINVNTEEDLNKLDTKKNKSKLTESKVLEIIQLVIDGKTNFEIGQLFNLHENTISDIRRGRSWKHVVKERPMPKNIRPSKNPNNKLTDSKVLEIKKLISETNLSNLEIAKKFNVSRGNISNIRNNKTWKHLL